MPSARKEPGAERSDRPNDRALARHDSPRFPSPAPTHKHTPEVNTPTLAPLFPGRFRRPSWLAALCVLSLSLAQAQQTAAPASDAEKKAGMKPDSTKLDDVVELTPFTVTSSGDRGYQAQSSLGGSRLKTDLKNIASPTTAFTAQFLEDAAITNTDDLAKYMLSTEYYLGADTGGQNGLGPVNRPLRVRGLAGGSYTTNFFKTGVRFDTFSLDRVDQSRGPNSVLFGIGDPGGIINVSTKRAILGKQRAEIAFQGKDPEGLRGEFDFNQPVGDNLAIRVAGVESRSDTWRNWEYDNGERGFGTIKWRLGQKTELNVEGERGHINKATKRTVTGYDAYSNWVGAGRNLNAAASAPQQIIRIVGNNVPYIVYNSNAGTVSNWVNKTSSSLRTTADGEPVPITDFNLVPKEVTFYGPGYSQDMDYTRLSAYLTHSFTPNLNVEIAAMRMDRHSQVWDAQGAPQNYLKVDTNATLPSGAANPNAGKPYLESLTQVNMPNNRDDSIRAIGSYTRDFGRFGKHTLAVVGEADFGKIDQQLLRETIITNAPNAATPDNNNNRLFRRTYVDLSGPSSAIVMGNFRAQPVQALADPASGTAYTAGWMPFNQNTQLNSSRATSTIGMLQSSFWHNRINTVIGGSYDERQDYLGTQTRAPIAGFTGGVIVPVRSHTPFKSHASSVSFSGVFYVVDWLGLTYSQAANSSLPSYTGRLNSADGSNPYAKPPTPRGKSKDYGIKLDLWNHRVFLTAQYFETSDVNDFGFSPIITTTVNPIWNALQVAGVPVPAGYTYDQIFAPSGGLPTIYDISTGASFSGATNGVELELTANPTEHWRVFANFSHSTTTNKNIGPEMRAYVDRWMPFWQRNANVPLSGTAGTVGSQATAVANAVVANYVLADGQQPVGQMKDKLNLRTSYDFASGRLKGVTVGGGMRWNGKPVTGYFSSLDSTGKVVAQVAKGSEQFFLDLNAAYRRKVNLLSRSTLMTIQLNVNNALNNDAFVNLRVGSDGAVELYKFNTPIEWILSTRFSF